MEKMNSQSINYFINNFIEASGLIAQQQAANKLQFYKRKDPKGIGDPSN